MRRPTAHGEPPLSDSVTGRLLALALPKSLRPFDKLVVRLHEPDGAAWWSTSIDALLSGEAFEAPELARAAVPLAGLREWKDRCKAIFTSTTDRATAERAMAGYCTAVAAAIVGYRTMISERLPLEWHGLFRDLAVVTPVPWPELFHAAARATGRREEESGVEGG